MFDAHLVSAVTDPGQSTMVRVQFATTLLVMPADLPIDVLTELGRVTWAAIKLEDYAESYARSLSHQAPDG